MPGDGLSSLACRITLPIDIVETIVPDNRRRTRTNPLRPKRRPEADESRGGEIVTIAWTVSVTGLVIADLMLIAMSLFVRSQPHVQPARLLELVMLLSASAMGVLSLALLPVVWRARRLKPPLGYIAFAVCAAAAPIAATIVRLLS
jgi:hypothetical protein